VEKAKDEKKEFGVVVLDIRMPDMDGFQTFKEVKAISPNTNVLFITAFEYSQKDIVAKVSNPKARVLRKPFSRAELLQSISDVIEN
jgi:DNA-binding NtrC family response regulator